MFNKKIDNLIKRMFIASIQKERLYGASIISCISYKKITVFGENNKKSSPMQKQFADIPEKIYNHAEVDVINRAKRILTPVELSLSTLIIIRYTIKDLDFEYGRSVPCKGCQKAIKEYNIKNVVCHDGKSFVHPVFD